MLKDTCAKCDESLDSQNDNDQQQKSRKTYTRGDKETKNEDKNRLKTIMTKVFMFEWN